MGPLIFVGSLLILFIVWNPFETNEKSNSLANKMRLLSKKSVKLQQDNERSFYKVHIREWKETPFYQFVLDAIKRVAEKGEDGVIIKYYFGKSGKPPIKPYYATTITSCGLTTAYVCFSYYFSLEEENNLSDDNTRESYLNGIETYLKKEGFYVKSGNDDHTFSVSW